MIEHDAVIALSGGIDNSGMLLPETKARVDTALRIAESHNAEYVIMAGGLSYLGRSRSPVSAAQAMTEYAVGYRHFDESRIALEEESGNTIGDACLVKMQLTEPQDWKRLIVVTTDSHLKRADRIFRHVMGPDYSLKSFPAKDYHHPRYAHEFLSNLLVDRVFGDTEPGDHEQIYERLELLTPGYGETSRRVAVANLIRDILRLPLKDPLAAT